VCVCASSHHHLFFVPQVQRTYLIILYKKQSDKPILDIVSICGWLN
jgi:hypothetical protein